MLDLTHLSKAVLIVDTAIEKQILSLIGEAGATGYTAMPCGGRGYRTVFEEPFMSHSQIRVEVITSRKIAEQIIQLIERKEFALHPSTAFIETVEVMDASKFVK